MLHTSECSFRQLSHDRMCFTACANEAPRDDFHEQRMVLQILKVVPYSALQLYSYDIIKRRMAGENRRLSVTDRMIAGAAAGMIATLVSSLCFSWIVPWISREIDW